MKTLTVILTGAMLSGSVSGYVPETRKDSYGVISERNLFGLKPADQPATPTQPAAPALPRLVLTGITTILGNKRALLKAVPPGNKPGEQSKEQSFILTEGQREEFLEVIQINEDEGSVTVRNSGAIMTLTFDKDGAKLPDTQPGPGTPAGAQLPTTTATYANPAVPNAATGSRATPTRTFRLPTPGNQGQQAANPAYAPSGSAGGVPSPLTSSSTSPTAVQPSAQPTTPAVPTTTLPMSPEEQAALLEVQREATRNEPNAPPLPPTGLESQPQYVYPSNPIPPGATAPGRTPPLIPYYPQ